MHRNVPKIAVSVTRIVFLANCSSRPPERAVPHAGHASRSRDTAARYWTHVAEGHALNRREFFHLIYI